VRRGVIVRKTMDIEPDEIFLDSSNLPEHDARQLEGRVIEPIGPFAIAFIAFVFVAFGIGYGARAYALQITQGSDFAVVSESNRLDTSVIFGERGVIYDRNGVELAWNVRASSTQPYSLRKYASIAGLGHVLGYLRYPKSDSQGAWWRTEYTPLAGVEKTYDEQLRAVNGKILTEVNAKGKNQEGQMLEPARDGEDLHLSIDSEVHGKLYDILSAHAREFGFRGGASVIMDVQTGEVIALASFPDYSPQIMTDGVKEVIADYTADTHTPFLDRTLAGAYTPGSIVKPLFAAAALMEKIITPDKGIFSPGFITIPNPYQPDKPTIMKDWRAHGWTDMRQAIAVSSDVYFYSIGGGYEGQKGLGITKIDEWARHFGLGTTTGIALPGEMSGIIPTPAWKKEAFGADEEWRLGDTYNTSIGQYGFQVTPIQVARYVSAIANGGTLYEPHVIKGSVPIGTKTDVSEKNMKVVREGMRMAVTWEKGTEHSLNLPGVQIAGKTGTAQQGTHNQFMNSWAIGFWPYERPKYAFATLMEHAPAGTLSGAAPAMQPFFLWLVQHHPEYSNPTTTPQ
jgi:penicillin-binding protein 2